MRSRYTCVSGYAAGLKRVVSAVLLVGAMASSASGQAQTDLWNGAKSGHFATAEAISEAIIGDASEPIKQFRHTLEERETQRAERMVEVRKELEAALEKNAAGGETLSGVHLSDALRAATELQMLGDTPEQTLKDAEVAQAVRLADAQARASEASGSWVMAAELYYRLNALHNETNRYGDDVSRLNSQLTMLKMYAPRTYWKLRNDRRLAEELEPLPPYNPKGDSFEEKLDGIDRSVVARAIVRAVRQHVESPSPDEMLAAAYRHVGVMLESDEIVKQINGGRSFDPQARADLKRFYDEAATQYEAGTRQASLRDIAPAIREMLSANAQTLKLPDEPMLHEFGNGAMSALDEYSQVIWPYAVDRFRRMTSGQFVGIGVQISLDAMSQLKVVTPLAGTPAQRAGLKANDVIAKVNGEPTLGYTLDQAVDIITGPKGTPVELTIERPIEDESDEDRIETFDVNLIRDVIALKSVLGWKRTGPGDDDWNWFIDEDSGIGYIRLSQFQNGSTRDLRRAVRAMQSKGLNGLILDLRFDPGGLLDEAVGIVGQYVTEKKVVSIEGADDHVMGIERTGAGLAPLAMTPTVVLVNEGSASASEIVSGALQDYSHAGLIDVVIVGQRSFGKGSVQNVWELPAPKPTLIKLTTQYYRLPMGRLIHRDRHPDQPLKGIEPDLTVSMLPEQITEAARIRRDADVMTLDEFGKPLDPESAVDPDTLIYDGIDVQLHTALLLLQSRAGRIGSVAVNPDVPGKMHAVP